MKIGVCFKIVPDYEGLVPEEWRDPENLDFTYVKKMYGCFDEAALEMALRIADGCKGAGSAVETVAVTCGAPAGAVSEGLLRALFAAGFDDVALLPAVGDFSPMGTARLLASYFKENPVDLILTGRMVGPNDSGMTPFYLANELSLPLFTELTAARYDGLSEHIEITCKDADSLNVYGLTGGAIGTAGDADAAYLRLFPLKARMEAKKRSFTRWTPEENAAKEGASEKTVTGAGCGEVLLRFIDEEAGDGPHYIPAAPAEDAADFLIRVLKEETADVKASEPIHAAAADAVDAAPAENSAMHLPEDITLFQGTPQEKEIAMRFAAARELPCHTDILSFREENGVCYAVRHAYSAHLEGYFPASGSVCILSSAAPEALQELAQTPHFANLLHYAESDAALLREIPLERKEDISAARIVLLGGKGLGKKENYRRLEALASRLGAVCGCTRPVAMAGWAPYDKVVGLSGATLQADVCIAFGVSGAAPLMKGASGAARLIAVNDDPMAPIFNRCNDGVVADCLEILGAMEALAAVTEGMETQVSEEE